MMNLKGYFEKKKDTVIASESVGTLKNPFFDKMCFFIHKFPDK